MRFRVNYIKGAVHKVRNGSCDNFYTPSPPYHNLSQISEPSPNCTLRHGLERIHTAVENKAKYNLSLPPAQLISIAAI